MTEKITWFEEVLRLEPNSKLFFPLAQAYMQDQRPGEAAAVLRKGLAIHPEHLEARLLLIECLSPAPTASQEGPLSGAEIPDAGGTAIPELESLTAVLAGHPAFWREWAAQSRAQGRSNLAVTLDMLAVQLGGARINWGTLLEQGLRAVTGRRDDFPVPASQEEPAFTTPEPDPEPEPTPTPEPERSSDPEHESEPEPETFIPEAVTESPEAEPLLEEENLDAKPLEDMEPFDGGSEDVPDDDLGDAAEDTDESDLESSPETLPESVPEGDPERNLGDASENLSDHLSDNLPEDAPEEVSEGTPEEDIEEAPENASEAHEQASQAPPVEPGEPAEPETVDAPGPEAEDETPLSEGERRYYETKTYADLLAKQGEQEEALGLYAKLLQTSPDDEQRLDLETRIQELRDRLAKGPRESDSKPIEPKDVESRPEPEIQPEGEPASDSEPDSEPRLGIEKEAASQGMDASSGSSTPPSPKTATTKQTLKKLADRLESRAGK